MAIFCFCGKSSADVAQLRQHLAEINHGIMCSCATLVGCASSLVLHQKAQGHHGHVTHPALTSTIYDLLKCPLCPGKKPFPNNSALKAHAAAKHPQKSQNPPGLLRCPLCPGKRPFPHPFALKTHAAAKHPQKSQNLPVKPKTSPTLQKLGDTSGGTWDTFCCDLCKHAPFASLELLTQHKRSEHSDALTKMKCTICNQQVRCEPCAPDFESRHALDQHRDSVQHGPINRKAVQVERTQLLPKEGLATFVTAMDTDLSDDESDGGVLLP